MLCSASTVLHLEMKFSSDSNKINDNDGDCGIHVGHGEGNLCMHIPEVFS